MHPGDVLESQAAEEDSLRRGDYLHTRTRTTPGMGSSTVLQRYV